MKMRTVQRIIEKHGGLDRLKLGFYEGDFYIRLKHESMMPLIIKHIGENKTGSPLISVSHTYIQNGDVMRDPEMVFEVYANQTTMLTGGDWIFQPTLFRQDNLGIYNEIIWTDMNTGKLMINPSHHKSALGFMRRWDSNIKNQGYYGLENVIGKVELV